MGISQLTYNLVFQGFHGRWVATEIIDYGPEADGCRVRAGAYVCHACAEHVLHGDLFGIFSMEIEEFAETSDPRASS